MALVLTDTAIALRTRRVRCKYSQAQLARLVHLPLSKIRKFEAAMEEPSYRHLMAICEVLECTWRELFEDIDLPMSVRNSTKIIDIKLRQTSK